MKLYSWWQKFYQINQTSYILRGPQNFAKSSPYFWLSYIKKSIDGVVTNSHFISQELFSYWPSFFLPWPWLKSTSFLCTAKQPSNTKDKQWKLKDSVFKIHSFSNQISITLLHNHLYSFQELRLLLFGVINNDMTVFLYLCLHKYNLSQGQSTGALTWRNCKQ